MVQTIVIDTEGFRAELKKKHLSQQNISVGLGHNKTYLSKYVSRGLIPIRDIDKIRSMYGISCSKYEKKERKKLEIETEERYAIDKQKLKVALSTKGKKCSDVGIDLGHSACFLSRQYENGTLPKTLIQYIYVKYGIPYDWYKDKENDDLQPLVEETKEESIDYNKLGKVILDSVTVAVINALRSLEIDRLPDMVLEHQNELFVQSGLMEKDEILSLFPIADTKQDGNRTQI